MESFPRNKMRDLSAAVVMVFACALTTAAFADNGKGKGKGHSESNGKGKGHQGKGGGDASRHFADPQRVVVHGMYGEQFRGGKSCPPGLAKKNNGCMPPGQAKKWHVGRPLPPDVVFYEVPAPLVVRLGPPPSGHRYVRVAADILLIAVGTSMVVDAIQDLGRM